MSHPIVVTGGQTRKQTWVATPFREACTHTDAKPAAGAPSSPGWPRTKIYAGSQPRRMKAKAKTKAETRVAPQATESSLRESEQRREKTYGPPRKAHTAAAKLHGLGRSAPRHKVLATWCCAPARPLRPSGRPLHWRCDAAPGLPQHPSVQWFPPRSRNMQPCIAGVACAQN